MLAVMYSGAAATLVTSHAGNTPAKALADRSKALGMSRRTCIAAAQVPVTAVPFVWLVAAMSAA